MNKKGRLILGVSIVVVLLGFLVVSNVESNRYEVSQAVSARTNLTGKIIDVNGTLIPGSNQWDTINRTLTFKMTDNIATIDVIYQGENIDVPSGYQNIQIIATGQFKDNLFVAIRKPLTKCPSKYESPTGDIAKNKSMKL